MFKFYALKDETLVDKLIGSRASIKLSSAFNLNDPYELKFNLVIDPFEKGHEIAYFKSNPDATKEDFRKWQQHVQKHNGYTWHSEQQQREALSQLITLSSFTEGNTNNLMWSHYTGNHKGICVEYHSGLFDFFASRPGFLRKGQITYSDLPPTVDTLEDDDEKLLKMAFNKQSEWQYEKEHRIVFKSNNVEDYVPIDTKYIKAVYIGSRTDQEIVRQIIETCKNTHIEVFYAITMGNTYKVTFEKHKESTIYMRAFWG